MHHLAKLGHRQLRQHVTTIKAFPFPVDKDELCWKLIQEGAGQDPGLQNVLSEVETDQCSKERLLDYVSAFLCTDQLFIPLPGLGSSHSASGRADSKGADGSAYCVWLARRVTTGKYTF